MPATVISGAPATARFILVTPDSRHLIAFGAHDGTADNPMNIRWSSREDFTDWTPTATNTAGTKLLDSGSEIITAVRTDEEILVFTDTSLYSMQFIGGNEVFGFFPQGDHGGIMSPHAAINHGGITYWMGREDFWRYDGHMQPIPCTVRDYVFSGVSDTQRYKTFAGVNSKFNEILWFYQDTSSTSDVNRYVLYNFVEQTWSIGSLDRGAWIDISEVSNNPIAIGVSGYIYEHESGNDGNGDAITWYLETADFDLGDGDEFMHVDSYMPDFVRQTNSINFEIRTRRYPQAQQITAGPVTFASGAERVDIRARGRTASLYWTATTVGNDFRMGPVRLRLRSDGRR